MKYFSIFLILLSIIGCNVSNQVQTVDDVYFSTPYERQTTSATNYVDLNDRYLSMKSRSRRWNAFDDDFYYWSFPGRFGTINSLTYGWNHRFWNNDLYWQLNPFWNTNPFWSYPIADPFFPFYSYSPLSFRNSFYSPWLGWNPYSNIYINRSNNHNKNYYQYNQQNTRPYTRSFGNNNYLDLNRQPNYGPRQFNLGTYGNQNRTGSTGNVTPNSNSAPRSGSAPIRKFD